MYKRQRELEIDFNLATFHSGPSGPPVSQLCSQWSWSQSASPQLHSGRQHWVCERRYLTPQSGEEGREKGRREGRREEGRREGRREEGRRKEGREGGREKRKEGGRRRDRGL